MPFRLELSARPKCLPHPSSPLPGTRRQRHVLFGRVSSLPPFTGSTFAGRPGARFDALPRTQGGFSSARPCPRRPILHWVGMQSKSVLSWRTTVRRPPHPTALRCKSTHQQIRVGTQICWFVPCMASPITGHHASASSLPWRESVWPSGLSVSMRRGVAARRTVCAGGCYPRVATRERSPSCSERSREFARVWNLNLFTHED